MEAFTGSCPNLCPDAQKAADTSPSYNLLLMIFLYHPSRLSVDPAPLQEEVPPHIDQPHYCDVDQQEQHERVLVYVINDLPDSMKWLIK